MALSSENASRLALQRREVYRVALAALAVLAGCGKSAPTKYRVEGTASWQGAPVANGNIVVEAVDGQVHAEGAKIADGKFSFLSEPGRKKVRIFASREVPGKIDPAMNTPVSEPYIPGEFNVNTTLEAEVLPQDENRWTFDLPTKP